jgi:hypothetical protein
MNARARVGAAVLVLIGLVTSLASAAEVDDLRWCPSERWARPSSARIRIAELRPWGDLPVAFRSIEAVAPLRRGVSAQAQALAWDAASVRGATVALDVGLRRGSTSAWLGARWDQLRVGARASHAEAVPRAALTTQVRAGAMTSVLVASWSASRTGEPVDSWSGALHTEVAGARLALERGPDRWGTGAVVYRALAVPIGSALTVGVATSAEDLRVLACIDSAPWELRVSAVVDGPRVGARAIEVGWSR